MKKRIKIKIVVLLVFIIIFALVLGLILKKSNIRLNNNNNNNSNKEVIITDFKNMKLNEVEDYVKEKDIDLEIIYQYDELDKDLVISSSLDNNKLSITVSKGKIPYQEYIDKKVNELGKVPIMMYHGIVDTNDNKYTGGNVDKDGYNRTSKAFLNDLEFYYSKGYRMVRLDDYINGIIDVDMGYSPIILTFDDGNMNNFKVIEKKENGDLVFDPNSAIGILETIKKKYPDYNITATFFLNSTLCNQKEYNEDIIKWLVNNGYDIGNHTTNHANFSNINTTKTQEVVGKMYEILDNIIPDKYVKIVALPFGSPYKKTHANYQYILNGKYNDFTYQTDAALRVGWESEVSPFNTNFDKTFLKRCRAYDNNGKDFDIEMNFKLLDTTRYISDGDKDVVVIPVKLKDKVNTNLKVITYEESV